MFFAKAFVDTFFRVPLLAGQFFVFVKIAFDEGDEGGEFRRGGSESLVSAGLFVPRDFVDGVIAHFEVASGFALGHSKGEKGVADGSPKFHVL